MEQYEVICNIGKGSFSKVFKIKRKIDEKIFVWKEMEFGKMSEKEKSQLVQEVNILREYKHPNIVKYYDRIIDKQNMKIYIIMEYCEGGDLAQFLKKLKKEKQEFPEDAIWKIFSQIVLAIYEIHKRKEGKILHRDIKPANIFLDSSNNVKLGDFGLARMLGEESEYAHTSVGTPYYMSPEIIDEKQYNEKSDIWAVGCLLFELCALNPPFIAQNYLALALKIKQGVFQRIPLKYSEELQRVISWCLQMNSKDRPSVDDLIVLPIISLKLREKRLKEKKIAIQKREEAVQKKEEQLEELENKLNQKQVEIEKLLQTLTLKSNENKENLKPNIEFISSNWIPKKEGYLPINMNKIESLEKIPKYF